MANFKERFNLLFEEADLSQEEFGKLFSVSKGQVFNWRSGRGEPDTETLKLIANKSGVSSDWLIGATNDPTPVKVLLDKVSVSDKTHVILGDTPATSKQEASMSMDDKLKLLPKEVQQKIISAANALLAVEKEIKEDRKQQK